MVGIYENPTNKASQRGVVDIVKAIIEDTIMEKLDVKAITKNWSTFCLADLGCSVGPNTFKSVQNLIDAVNKKSKTQNLKPSNFLVFFNDLKFNDFNALFNSFPPDRKYYGAGVPGSFYGQLFPDSSVHLVHSSYCLQWLSEIPEEVLDWDSPAWNKGRIHYNNAPQQVVNAFAAQFERDVGMFLDARSKEVVEGGMMVINVPATSDDHGETTSNPGGPMGLTFDYLGSCFMDMAKEGIVSEALVDSFNIPVFTTTPKKLTEVIEENGCFSIERMELTVATRCMVHQSAAISMTMNARAGLGDIISEHFGDEILDLLFDRFYKNVNVLLQALAKEAQGTQLTVILKRRSST